MQVKPTIALLAEHPLMHQSPKACPERSVERVGKGGLGVFKFTAQQLGWKCTDVALSPDEVAYPAQEVLSVE